MRQKKTYPKRKRKRANKSKLKRIVWLFALVLVLWALAGWYLGTKAEKAFKGYLQTHAQLVGEKLLRIELLNYRKTLLGATAQLRLSSDIPIVSEKLGEVTLLAKLLNGPLFVTKKGVSVGSSRWFIKIDEDNLTVSERENIRALFPESLPTAIVRTDFKKKAHYLAKLQADFAKALVTGVYSFETETQEEYNRGAITLNDVSYGVLPNNISADKINISYQHQKAISAGYKPGTTSISSPLITLQHSYLQGPLSLKLKAKSNLSTDDDFLNGFLSLALERFDDDSALPFDSADLSFMFKGLSAEGLMAFSEANAEVDNLQQQIDWIREDMGEYPEARDEVINLADSVKRAKKDLKQSLQPIFQDENSLIYADIITQKKADRAYLKAKIKPSNKRSDSDSALSWFAGHVDVDLSDDVHRFITPLLKQYSKTAEYELKQKFKFDLSSQDFE